MTRNISHYYLLLIHIAVLFRAATHSSPLQDYGYISVNADRRLVDQYGREVYFHDVNVIYKAHPYVPTTHTFDPIYSFSTKDMQQLEELGLNIIRLGLMWPGAQPDNSGYNDTYYDVINEIITQALDYNIYTLLDMHQDVLSECFCGEGIPKWLVQTKDSRKFPFPFAEQFSGCPDQFPSTENCLKHFWSDYYITEAQNFASQALYDESGILHQWGDFWQKSAEFFKNKRQVIGYELINEPWAGNIYQKFSDLDPIVADVVNLQPAYDSVTYAIRQVDDIHIVFFESVTWADLGTGFTRVPLGVEYENRSALSFHFYKPPNLPIGSDEFKFHVQDMENLKCGGMITEFGGDEEVMADCDKFLQSWIMWQYKVFANLTGDVSCLYFNNGTIDYARASKLSRTYAQVVAGKTLSMYYNPKSHTFILSYITSSKISNTITQIYLNKALHYPNGPYIQVQTEIGYKITRPTNNIIWVIHDKSNGVEIKVIITT